MDIFDDYSLISDKFCYLCKVLWACLGDTRFFFITMVFSGSSQNTS